MRLTRKKRRRSRKDTAVAWGGLALAPQAALGSLRGAKLLSLFLLLALTWLIVQLVTSERFCVQEVAVYGNRLVSAETIYERSGLEGRSLFLIQPRMVEAAIAQIPQVKEARLRIGLPHWVYIEVEEFRPLVAWEVGGSRHGVTEEGRLLPAEAILEGIPLIQDLDGVGLQPGDQIEVAVIRTALELHDLLPEASHLGYSRATGLIYITAQGWPVYFEPGETDLAWKVGVLEALLRDLEAGGKAVEFIDLRFKRPYYRAG